MATDARGITRRSWLGACAAGWASGPTWAGPSSFAALGAAWEAPDAGWHVGVIQAMRGVLAPVASLEVPTRAHGLLWRGNELLALARRPGDWLVRWSPGTGEARWTWIEAGRAFNGHAVPSPDGKALYTTETDLESGAGLIGVRDAASLEKVSEWRTGGMDPHALVLAGDGSLLVANGGIPTLPESGRLKIGLDRMDASLARLAPSGEPTGQWRLADGRLSVRHLAWGARAGRPVLGIALQAEHDDASRKLAAPVLALFDGQRLAVADAPRSLAGYGGDIAFANGLFAVSCPRAQGVALHDADGAWRGFLPLEEACALASGSTGTLLAGGRAQAVAWRNEVATPRPLGAIRLDNHWVPVPQPSLLEAKKRHK